MSYHGHFENQKPRKRKSAKKIILIVIAVLLVLVTGVVIAAVSYYKSMLNKVNIIEMPAQVTETAAAETTQTTVATETTAAATTVGTTVETTVPPMTPEDILNILVVGQSGRAGEEAALADTMILVSINKYTKTLTLTSFLRDTYVDLPDYRDANGKLRTCGWNKLTSCYAVGYSFGGTGYAMGMTNLCLQNNFGVEVDYNVEINFESLIKVVDLMGGVYLELTQAEADYLNKDNYQGQTFTAGFQGLDGTDALSYARMRKAEGDNDSDIKRTSRQRYMLEMLFKQLNNQGLSFAQKVANEVLPMITTNMPEDKITECLVELLPMLPSLSIESGTCPVETTYWPEYKDTPDGYLPVLMFDQGQNTRLMRAITEGETAE